jgi:hypothetical protein
VKEKDQALRELDYNKFENIGINIPELKDYIPIIDDYYSKITGLIQNYVLYQLRRDVFEISLANLKKIEQTLEIKSKSILDKYQQVNEDILNITERTKSINLQYRDFIDFQNAVFRRSSDSEIISSMDRIIDKSNYGQTFLRFLISQHGLVHEVI